MPRVYTGVTVFTFVLTCCHIVLILMLLINQRAQQTVDAHKETRQAWKTLRLYEGSLQVLNAGDYCISDKQFFFFFVGDSYNLH